MNEYPTNSDDVIDSRQVIEAIDELNGEIEGCEDPDELADLTEQRDALVALADQGDSVDDWLYGVTLVRDSYFEDYAREFAEDIGAINSDATWPNTCIDWEQAARELRMDYTSIDFDGVDYWAR